MKISSNLAISLDGKIANTDRAYFPLGSKRDLKLMIDLRTRSDAILLGASTLRTFKKPCSARGKKIVWNIVCSHALERVNPKWPFFRSKKVKRLLVVSPATPPQRLQQFAATSEILKLSLSNKKSLQKLLEVLKEKGIRNLVVEGGGDMMWNFVEHDLINEYYVTLTPKILGGQLAPALVGGKGFRGRHHLNLRISKMKRIGNEIFFVYKSSGLR